MAQASTSNNITVTGASFLSLPREIRDVIYDDEYKRLRILRGYSLQLPWPTCHFAVGDPFVFLNAHPIIRDEWLGQLPIIDNIEVTVDSKPLDEYRRSNPLLHCKDIVSPLEKVFCTHLTIYFKHALRHDACTPDDKSNRPERGQVSREKGPDKLQHNRISEMKHLLEHANKTLRGLRAIHFAGDLGRHEVYNSPAPYNKARNEDDTDHHVKRIRMSGGMVHLSNHSEFCAAMELIKNWKDKKIAKVTFTPGWWSEDPAKEQKMLDKMEKEHGREGLRFAMEGLEDEDDDDDSTDTGRAPDSRTVAAENAKDDAEDTKAKAEPMNPLGAGSS